MSDGISNSDAKEGKIVANKIRTLLKTGIGKAILTFQNGTSIIMDSESTIEFNHDDENGKGQPFIFNLVKGRVLVINEQKDPVPTQVIIGGILSARIYAAIMGLEIQTDQDVNRRVDCLVGNCLVNGAFLLLPGQNAQVKADNALQVADGVSYGTWFSLDDAMNNKSSLSNMVASVSPTATFIETKNEFPTSVTNTITFTVSNTASNTPTSTTMPSITNTRVRLPLPTRTPTPRNEAPRTATPLPTATKIPTSTLVPSSTATVISIPTSTDIPFPTYTPFPTVETPLVPTNTEIPTDIPTQPVPTETPIPTENVIPTEVESPTTPAIPTMAITPPPPL